MAQNINSLQAINPKNIYVICGRTDMRKGIDGLATVIQDNFNIDQYSNTIFSYV